MLAINKVVVVVIDPYVSQIQTIERLLGYIQLFTLCLLFKSDIKLMDHLLTL